MSDNTRINNIQDKINKIIISRKPDIILWKFLLDLLMCSNWQPYIRWTGKELEFILIDGMVVFTEFQQRKRQNASPTPLNKDPAERWKDVLISKEDVKNRLRGLCSTYYKKNYGQESRDKPLIRKIIGMKGGYSFEANECIWSRFGLSKDEFLQYTKDVGSQFEYPIIRQTTKNKDSPEDNGSVKMHHLDNGKSDLKEAKINSVLFGAQLLFVRLEVLSGTQEVPVSPTDAEKSEQTDINDAEARSLFMELPQIEACPMVPLHIPNPDTSSHLTLMWSEFLKMKTARKRETLYEYDPESGVYWEQPSSESGVVEKPNCISHACIPLGSLYFIKDPLNNKKIQMVNRSKKRTRMHETPDGPMSKKIKRFSQDEIITKLLEELNEKEKILEDQILNMEYSVEDIWDVSTLPVEGTQEQKRHLLENNHLEQDIFQDSDM